MLLYTMCSFEEHIYLSIPTAGNLIKMFSRTSFALFACCFTLVGLPLPKLVSVAFLRWYQLAFPIFTLRACVGEACLAISQALCLRYHMLSLYIAFSPFLFRLLTSGPGPTPSATLVCVSFRFIKLHYFNVT